MSELLPALNLIATLGWRRTTLEIARGIERRGFAGISVSSQYSNMAQCLGLAFATEGYHSPLRLRQSIRRPSTSSRTARPIFTRCPVAVFNSVLASRMRRPINGWGSYPANRSPTSAPLSQSSNRAMALECCLRSFSQHCASGWSRSQEKSPTAVFANASLSDIGDSLRTLPAEKRNDAGFFIGNRIRTCICDNAAEAKAVLRRTMTNYALMPNYRNYWKEAGYVEEMTAIEKAVAEHRLDDLPKYLPDR